MFLSNNPRTAVRESHRSLNDYWFHELQPRLAALSTRGHLIIEEHAERPDAVTEAVHNVVTEVRAEQQRRL